MLLEVCQSIDGFANLCFRVDRLLDEEARYISGLLIIGAGGHGKVVADIACEIGCWSKIAFLDDKFPDLSEVLAWPVLGEVSEIACYLQEYPDIVVAIGNNAARLDLLNKVAEAGFRLPVLVHPQASVSKRSILGPGTVVVQQAAVNTNTRIGRGTIINTGATIDHDCVLGDCVHVAPNASLGGGAVIGECGWIGMGASIIEQVKVGSGVVVGAGSVIIKDIPDDVTVAGVPGRIIKRHQTEGL